MAESWDHKLDKMEKITKAGNQRTFARRCDVGLSGIRQHLSILQNADAQLVCAALEAQRNHGLTLVAELNWSKFRPYLPLNRTRSVTLLVLDPKFI